MYFDLKFEIDLKFYGLDVKFPFSLKYKIKIKFEVGLEQR